MVSRNHEKNTCKKAGVNGLAMQNRCIDKECPQYCSSKTQEEVDHMKEMDR